MLKNKCNINFPEEAFQFIDNLTIKDAREHIASCFSFHGYQRSYTKKSPVFQYNETANEAYVVESGRVRIYKLTPEGKEITFQIVYPGESLGLAELFINCPRIRYAEAMCKTTLWVMKKEQLFNHFFSSKELCLILLWILHQKVLRYQNIIEDLAVLPVRDRIVKLLVRLCKEQGRVVKDFTVIDFPITHEEIAQMVGSTRQTVTFILNELRKEGILTWERKKIKILRWMDLIDNSF